MSAGTIVVPSGGRRHDREARRQQAAKHQRVQRRHQLLVREIA
jgi:hypothetical protein